MRTSFVDAYITSFTAVTIAPNNESTQERDTHQSIAPNNESTDEYHVLVVCEAR
jgi:hypothetical protein